MHEQKTCVLGGYTGRENRGTEAIAVSTSALFHSLNCRTVLGVINKSTPKAGNDPGNEYDSCGCDDVVFCCPVNRIIRLFTSGWNKLFHNIYPAARISFSNILTTAKKGMLIHIGGDTFCYDTALPHNALVFWAKRKKITTVLWGASIEDKTFDNRLTLNALRRYDKIYARESLSYDLLLKHGFSGKVFKTADPAFTLSPKEVAADEAWWQKKVIGINLSPYAMNENKDPMIAINACEQIIRKLLSDTNWNIALIPHVWINEQQGDYVPLNMLAERFKNNERVCLVHGKYDCCQIKYLISKCYAFLATRTHASIAAYSSMVPTLVLGYSIKSKGIATDLFGDDKGYVLPVQQLKSSSEIYDAFMRIIDNRNEIAERLHRIIPDYQKMAFAAAEDAVRL